MILPATGQILLHSSILIWTAYYLIVKPSVLLNSTIVTIFGQALQLPRFSASRFGDHGLGFAGLTLLYLALVDLIPIFRRDWTYYHATTPLRVALTFSLTAFTYVHTSPSIGNDFTFTALFTELFFGFWLYATLRSTATGGRAPIHES